MERPVRIAVVGHADPRLTADLRQLPLRPDVRALASLVDGGEALQSFQPDLLLVTFADDTGEEVGAARMLQRLWPALRVLVVTSAERESTLAAIAERLAARLLVYPETPQRLAATIDSMLEGPARPQPELFVDLAHGLADEINNPLMFVSGHLQLLRATLDPATSRDARDQIDAAMRGLTRIQTSVDRLRLLSQAAGGPRHRQPTDLAALISEVLATRRSGEPAATVAIGDGPHFVDGDRDQLRLAVAAIVQFADELAALEAQSHLQLDALERARRLRLTTKGQSLAAWQLPNSFEPFYPQRVLRGQSHGLGVFVAQTVVLGHRGQASVRRRSDGTLQFDFVLPD